MTFTTGCQGCGCELTGRARVWCRECASNGTQENWYDNHLWTYARERARRDACPGPRSHGSQCARCGELTTAPEVNHKTPVLGKHGVTGCHHHQENLEVLCRPCHLAETRAQRERGELVRPATGGNT